MTMAFQAWVPSKQFICKKKVIVEGSIEKWAPSWEMNTGL